MRYNRENNTDTTGMPASYAAREALKGHWNQAAAVSLVLLCASLLCSVITGLFGRNDSDAAAWMSLATGFILQLLLAVLIDGGLLVFRDLLRKHTVDPRRVIEPFRTQPDRFLIVELLMTAPGVAFLLPVLISAAAGSPAVSVRTAAVLAAAGVIASLCVRIFFAPSVYYLLEDGQLGAGPALRRAKDVMKGRRLPLLKVLLPFIGYLLLSFLTFGISLIWVIPYLLTTLASFFESLPGVQVSDP